MSQNYIQPSIDQKMNFSVIACTQYLNELNACVPGPDGGPNCGEEDETGQLGFCAQGISQGSDLNGCFFTLPNCPDVELTNCQTEAGDQGSCDNIGGGLAVSCFITIDCESDCNDSFEGATVTCGTHDAVDCPEFS
jgi:hypothetical protein